MCNSWLMKREWLSDKWDDCFDFYAFVFCNTYLLFNLFNLYIWQIKLKQNEWQNNWFACEIVRGIGKNIERNELSRSTLKDFKVKYIFLDNSLLKDLSPFKCLLFESFSLLNTLEVGLWGHEVNVEYEE